MTGLDYFVRSTFLDGRGRAFCKDAEVELDSSLEARTDAFNPAELLLASMSACMTKGALRAAKLNNLEIRGIEVRLKGTRQDAPPRMIRIDYELLIDTDESDRRLELIHQNVLKFGTVTSTLAAAMTVVGSVARLQTDRQSNNV